MVPDNTLPVHSQFTNHELTWGGGCGHWSKSRWLARIFGRAIPAPYGNYSKGSGDCRVDFFDGIPARREPEVSGLRCAQLHYAQLGGGFLSPFQGFLFLGMTRYPGWRRAYPGLLYFAPSGLVRRVRRQ